MGIIYQDSSVNKIQSVTCPDVGSYQCIIRNSVGSIIGEMIPLSVAFVTSFPEAESSVTWQSEDDTADSKLIILNVDQNDTGRQTPVRELQCMANVRPLYGLGLIWLKDGRPFLVFLTHSMTRQVRLCAGGVTFTDSATVRVMERLILQTRWLLNTGSVWKGALLFSALLVMKQDI